MTTRSRQDVLADDMIRLANQPHPPRGAPTTHDLVVAAQKVYDLAEVLTPAAFDVVMCAVRLHMQAGGELLPQPPRPPFGANTEAFTAESNKA
jgi:hypothetical protein